VGYVKGFRPVKVLKKVLSQHYSQEFTFRDQPALEKFWKNGLVKQKIVCVFTQTEYSATFVYGSE